MNDFENSIAQQDVEIATELQTTAVVGENFYRVLYITSAVVEPSLLKKSTYESVIDGLSGLSDYQKAFAKNAMMSLFTYASDAEAYIISTTEYKKYKYKAYFVYIEPSYVAAGTSQNTYTPVTPVVASNPSTSNWYEQSGGDYTKSTAVVAVAGTAYYEVDATAVVPTVPSNPASEGWYELSGTSYVKATAAEAVTGTSYYELVADTVTPSGSEDPSSEGWYELSGDDYALTTDTTVASSKTYYEVVATVVSAVVYPQNPSSEGWYELDGTTLKVTTDTAVDSTKTYYTVTATQVTGVVYADNPVLKGWYEFDGTVYTLSTDTVADPTKTYYKAAADPIPSSLSAQMKAIFDSFTFDSEFSQCLTDLAVPVDLAKAGTNATLTTALGGILGELAKLNASTMVFVRRSANDLSFDENDLGYSPAMYQLGRTLGYLNAETGTCIGNSLDMVQCSLQDVLPTGSVGPSELEACDATVVNFFESNNLNYFKPLGNSTGAVVNKGGKDIKGVVPGANWLTNYVNYMVRVGCAEIITVMNTFKSRLTYQKCINQINTHMSGFVTLGRVESFQITAPAYGAIESAGDVLVIPEAWEGYYVDNVRKVRISGTLYIRQ